MNEVAEYIIDFLVRFPVTNSALIHYGKVEDAPNNTKIVIVPVFPDFEISTLPQAPFKLVDDTPVLFGDPKIEKKNGILIVYADIIASSFFLLSRYEEILKSKCRDSHGRFLAKDSIIFQQGYGNRPLVDEYGILLRKWLREAGADISSEQKGFSKIYLTHDVDVPFRFERLGTVAKQCIKNALRRNYSSSPLKKYLNEQLDENYTFPKLINYDKALRESASETLVESIYFLITAGSFFNRKYYNFFSQKTNRLIDVLNKSGAKLGLHVSHAAGANPQKIQNETRRFRNKLGFNALLSRHHFLQWQEPDDITFMEQAGISNDFTLSYADCVGFRVGTCRPYRFINQKTKTLTNVVVHPLEIMDCTLDRQNYMNLDYENALSKCREIINQVHKHNGELVLLWHNTEFMGQNYQEQLYKSVLDYLKTLSP